MFFSSSRKGVSPCSPVSLPWMATRTTPRAGREMTKVQWTPSRRTSAADMAVVYHALRAREEHRVSVAEEAVARGDRVAVGGQDAIAAGEGGDQDEERGPGQVEVGDQVIDRAEGVVRADEEVGGAGAGGDGARRGGGGLERADHGGADGDDGAAGGDERGGGGRDGEALGVHAVGAEIVVAHRGEGAEADVQRERGAGDAARLEGGEELR